MLKKGAIEKTESDGSEKLLIDMITRFSVNRAKEWLRVKFSSFDTASAEDIPCNGNKNEQEYFASAEIVGCVTRLSLDKSDDSNKPLLAVAIKMKRDLTERTSRLVQFNFAKKILQNAVAKDAKGFSGLPSQGLFFFYDKDGYFRLSLVSGGVEKRKFKFNDAKRQSFYIEPTAANNIVKRRFASPVRTFAELKDVFSVEQLTKEFYQSLFNWYTWAMSAEANVHFPNNLEDKTDDRKYNNEAIIRMITRLMFTWFIRQRKLVPDELFDCKKVGEILKKFEPDSMEQGTYYRCILQNLFFATFNCPQIGKGKLTRRWIDISADESGKAIGLSHDYSISTVYRYKDQFKDPSAFLEMMKRVPFLNCALFDCLDKVEREEDGGRKLYFDGFSSVKKRQAFVPNGLFFGESGIVNLFNRYEFTINENNADDSDVALDPELLGKVFENLLGAYNPETQETARNATGSFYTPREIVDYMVDESLKNYLKTKVLSADDKRLEDLFDRTKAAEGADTHFSSKEKAQLLGALYDCKILDPACGSGAFPMGVLHCMVRLLSRLDPQCISMREQLLARYKADKALIDPTESTAEREERIAELESRLKEGQHYPDYERKLYLIENCIYGVDIQPIATQISKLRFFISLLCDQLRTSYDPEAENFGLLSLPNLEAKFVCANTLISLPEVGALDASVGNIAELREELQANRHKIFRARSTQTKEKYKNKDAEIRDAIRRTVKDSLSKPNEDVIEKCREQIADAQKRRVKVAEPDWVEEEVAVQADLFSTFEKKKVRKDRNAPARDKIDAEISWAEETIKKEQAKADRSNVSAATRYADMVAGWDPYDQNASSKFFDPEWMFNIKDGFDVVIGNPPYGKIFTKESNEHIKEKFPVFGDTKDAFVAFGLYAFSVLKKEGVMQYIIPSSWHGGPAYKSFRDECLKYRMLNLIELPFDMFQSAYVDTGIFGIQNANPEGLSYVKTRRFGCKEKFKAQGVICDLIEQKLWHDVVDKKFILSKEQIGLERSLSRIKGTIGACVEAKRGVLLPKDLIGDKRTQAVNYPYFSGDVYRYEVSVEKKWIKFGVGFKEGPKEKVWYEGERLLLRRLMSRAHRLMTGYTDEAFVTNKNLYILRQKHDVELKFLLAIANSRLYSHLYASRVSGSVKDDFPQVTMTDFLSLPLPETSTAERLQFIKLVDQILASKAKNREADTSSLETRIDQLVYKLYGLTEEEIAVVEGAEEKKPTAPKSERPRRAPAAAVVADEDDEELE